ncbi:hypothetical protein OBBRIDRAFT_890275 [Obba rivulosa]|uniref:MYND-type domain-containing protein n=1 Tax=Obba rivulosa TaxID=1052685 RepID=A0A8E2ARP2_9APHY|nr:hypothetical protein OBBRIDRAFT_890275 [Obba rivulosa]
MFHNTLLSLSVHSAALLNSPTSSLDPHTALSSHYAMAGLTRDELLAALTSMKVEVPAETSISDDALDRRLQRALKAAQHLEQAVPHPPLDPATLPKWGPQRGPVAQAARRGNLDDAFFAPLDAAAREQARAAAAPADSAFADLRRLVGAVAGLRDAGQRWCVVTVDGRVAMNLRVLDIYELDARTPVLVVVYKRLPYEDAAARAGLRWIDTQLSRESGGSLHATAPGLKLLTRLLAMNTKTLSSSFRPKKDPTEKDFKVSFLLPVGPLDYEDVGKFHKRPLCARCGSPTLGRCSECMAVPYCSTECQKADRAAHKPACRSLQGGTWLTVPIVSQLPGFEHLPFVENLNRYNSRKAAEPVRTDAARPPPNIHDENPFLVKIQFSGGAHMLVYDRQRSFQVYFSQTKDAGGFQEIVGEIQGPRGGYSGLKMYRWAKRVSDWELSVCFDREPQTEIMW